MSAIERRIADFLLENAHLLRDYSSQQLADAWLDLVHDQSKQTRFGEHAIQQRGPALAPPYDPERIRAFIEKSTPLKTSLCFP